MLAINKKSKSGRLMPVIGTTFAIALLGAGLYLLSLVAAPTVAPFVALKPIEVNALPHPKNNVDRVVIPKLGVDIPYAPGVASLDKGAEWRHPDRGNPATGGNFIIAAHRFSIQPTPMDTIEKSPFYHIDKLVLGDKIIIDFKGTRYAYEIDKMLDVKPNQTEIEAPSETPKLTLYSCELGGAEAGRVVITAKPLGKVALEDNDKQKEIE